MEVIHSTIAGNEATLSNNGGFLIQGLGAGKDLVTVFNNSIIANNSDANFSVNEISEGSATVVSLGHNIVSDDGGGFFNATGDLTVTDPLLGAVSQNGGPTPTHSLPKNSPAIDTGSCFISGVVRDQRGYLRPFDVAGVPNPADGCDIGSVEWSDLDGDGTEDGDEFFDDGFEETP